VSETRLAISERYYTFIREHPEISAHDISLIARHAPQARRILDLGCGAGNFVAMCRERLGDPIGADPSLPAAQLCRDDGLPVVLADGTNLPFATSSLDVVRAKEIIEHILDLRPFMEEIFRVLRPGGLFLSRTPTQYALLYPINNFYDDYTHIRPLSRPGLTRLLIDTKFEPLLVEGHTPGRSRLERLITPLLGRLFPSTWIALASKPLNKN
jgi:SAM-dependent methyltransferase